MPGIAGLHLGQKHFGAHRSTSGRFGIWGGRYVCKIRLQTNVQTELPTPGNAELKRNFNICVGLPSEIVALFALGIDEKAPPHRGGGEGE